MVTGWKRTTASGTTVPRATWHGWVKDGRSWYYLDDRAPWLPAGSLTAAGSGWTTRRVAVGWTNIGNDWYHFEDDGRMLTGWQLTEDDRGGTTCANGVMATS